MSVQAGVWNFDGQPIGMERLVRVGESLLDYGPDGEASFFDAHVGMLYRHFHTTPESRSERQPHVAANGCVLTWDGRLDNRDHLISQLSDSLKDDKTDVAIVAAAFERWRTDCFAQLVGDWAVSIWNPGEQELVLARDYIGIRNLFYYLSPKGVTWCNHLAPLALCGDRFTLCDEYVASYLGLWPESHRTPYREIHAVAPGHFTHIRTRGLSEHAYWTFQPHLTTRYKTDREYEEAFRHLFRQSVSRRLRTGSPLLAELSGGIDSSSIVCMADRILSENNEGVATVDTFSSFDRNEPGEGDLPYFTKVEEKRGRIGHHAELKSSGDSIRFDYPIFIATPGFDSREEFVEAQSEVIRHNHYRVLLTGDGGDHSLGQGRDPRIQMADLLLRFRLLEVKKLLSAWSSCSRRPWIQLLFQSIALLLPPKVRTRSRSAARRIPWLNINFERHYKITDRVLPGTQGSWMWRPTVRESFQVIRDLTGLLTAFRPSVIERRYPFLDQTLIEFLTSIPVDQLLRPADRRSLLRRALVDILPSEITGRRTKSSGGRCYVLSLQRHWKAIEQILPTPVGAKLGYIDQRQLKVALTAMKSGHVPLHPVLLLRALSLELWLRNAIARGVLSVPNSIVGEACLPAQ